MKRIFRKQINESGRSMVEMLGILAIIGVLSFAGVKAYTYAMNKHRANELLDGASKRGVALSIQILSGKEELSISEFNNETDYGTFSNPTYTAGSETFQLTLSGVASEVCTMMKGTLGSRAIMVINGECGQTLTICFNTDLSKGVKVLDGQCVRDNSTNNNTGGHTGGEGSGTGTGEEPSQKSCTTSSECSGAAECINEKCVCSLTCSNEEVLDTDSCSCVLNCTSGTYYDGTSCVACPTHATCPGGTAGYTCDTGYTGEGCTECNTGYHMNENVCVPDCTETSCGENMVCNTSTHECEPDNPGCPNGTTLVSGYTGSNPLDNNACTCNSYDTNQCGLGYFCNFENTSQLSCHDDGNGHALLQNSNNIAYGVCTKIAGEYAGPNAPNGLGHWYLTTDVNWFTANSWCIGKGTTGLAICDVSEPDDPYSCDVVNWENAHYWPEQHYWVRDVWESCRGFIALPSEMAVQEAGTDSRRLNSKNGGYHRGATCE